MTLNPIQDWKWVLAQELSEVGGDLGQLMMTPQYVIWKQQVKMQFDLASAHLIFYIFHQLVDEHKDPIDAHKIHATLFEALQTSRSKANFSFVDRFCNEFFPNGYDKCLGKLQTVFEPNKQDYPQFFDPKKTTKIEIADKNDGAYIKEGPAFFKYFYHILSGYENGQHEDDEDSEIMPMPDLGENYEIFSDGVVVVQSRPRTCFT